MPEECFQPGNSTQSMNSCRGSVAAYPIDREQKDMRNILSPSLTLHTAAWKMTWQFAHWSQSKAGCFFRLCHPPKRIIQYSAMVIWKQELVVIWHKQHDWVPHCGVSWHYHMMDPPPSIGKAFSKSLAYWTVKLQLSYLCNWLHCNYITITFKLK